MGGGEQGGFGDCVSTNCGQLPVAPSDWNQFANLYRAHPPSRWRLWQSALSSFSFVFGFRITLSGCPFASAVGLSTPPSCSFVVSLFVCLLVCLLVEHLSSCCPVTHVRHDIIVFWNYLESPKHWKTQRTHTHTHTHSYTHRGTGRHTHAYTTHSSFWGPQMTSLGFDNKLICAALRCLFSPTLSLSLCLWFVSLSFFIIHEYAISVQIEVLCRSSIALFIINTKWF